MEGTDQSEPIEIGAARWDWLAVPLAGFACAGQMTDAVATFFSNMTFAIGAHLNYKREITSEAVTSGGPIITTE